MLYVQRPLPRNMSNKHNPLMSCDVDLHHVKWMKAMLPTRERPVYTMHVSAEKAGEAGVYHRCWVWPRVKQYVPTASWPASEGVRGSWPYPLGKSRPVTAKKHCGNFADNLSYPASLIILSVKFDPGGIDHTISLSPPKSKTKNQCGPSSWGKRLHFWVECSLGWTWGPRWNH